MFGRRVVADAKTLERCCGGRADDAAAGRILVPHVVQAQVGGIHHPSEVDVEGSLGGFLEVAVGVEGFGEVVRPACNPCVGEDMVDSAVFVFGVFE